MPEITEKKKSPESVAASATPSLKKKAPGLQFRRLFTKLGVSPYNEIEWELRTAQITDAQGNVIFEQKDVEVPKDWSMTATNIVASKYLHGTIGTPDRETGVRQLVTRVAETIRDWGKTDGYFHSDEDAAAFHDELAHILLRQYAAFNSPVWFNVGCDRIEPNSDAQNWHWNHETGRVEFSVTGYRTPQCSACFINSVKDSLDSILTLAKTEGMLFKWGSGTGTNLSPLRSSTEGLSGGGTASGPLSFMKGFDAFAGVIKSGGKTRRAAKMVILNIDHPDIVDFIECKAKEEAKAWSLVQAGYDGSSPDSEAYSSIFFQNANNSVRVTDDFMYGVVRDTDFSTRAIRDGSVITTYKAKDLLKKIAEATWQCGDPGMQFDTTINRWHTSKNTARINASNPCSEYMFLDDSACNLASLNLLKFAPNGTFDVASYRHAVDILITAIMCGEAYLQSSRIAELCEPLAPATEPTKKNLSETNLGSNVMPGAACPGWYINREPFLDVIRMHRASVNHINKTNVPSCVYEASKQCWDEALVHGEKFGYRNSQVTVLAPTGTIGFMMDCDTTGVEPDLALVKYKKLVGGGMIKIVNNTVPGALFKLGYTHEQANAIVSYIDATGTIEGAPHIKDEDLAVFDCSFKPAKGTRSISYMGHLRMMAATQPFISGAISKTVNLPNQASVEDIMEAYLQAWKLGLKAVAIYRDGCKQSQPLSAAGSATALSKKEDSSRAGAPAPHEEENLNAPPRAVRHKLQEERASITHKFNVGGHEGYITVGLYPDGEPGELFITMAKEGSTVSGLMDSFALAISIALQHGVPLKLYCEKFAHTRFEPSGWTNNPEIGFAKSIMDYIFRWLQVRFLTGQQQMLFENLRLKAGGAPRAPEAEGVDDLHGTAETRTPESRSGSVHASDALSSIVDLGDAPSCHYCGAIMTRNGSCYRCMSCGSTSGCS
jgi:ribonucleoside-diphosphate reductase alpha chain